MYHPHTRPLSTLPAALLDLSSSLHTSLHSSLPLLPTPARLLSHPLAPASLAPLARLLTISPLHVDTVAKAVCEAVLRQSVQGVVDTRGIKALAGWKEGTDGHGAGAEAEAEAEAEKMTGKGTGAGSGSEGVRV